MAPARNKMRIGQVSVSRLGALLQAAVLILILIPAPRGRATGTGSAIGVWKNDDATFEVSENEGKLSGKIVALKEPKTPEGKEKTDIHNPDPAKRDRAIIGLVFLSGFSKKSDTRWENGFIYDPKTGNTYSSFLELDGPEKIKVRGFIGISLVGRTEVWTRVNDGDHP
jgi:uncharacterized protein (DUF2147 family)